MSNFTIYIRLIIVFSLLALWFIPAMALHILVQLCMIPLWLVDGKWEWIGSPTETVWPWFIVVNIFREIK